MIAPGDIVLVDFTQANGVLKPRPVLILQALPPYGDLLICGITSQLHQYDPAVDIRLDESHGDFLESGLRKPSLLRLSKLAMIEQYDARMKGAIGRVGGATLREAQLRVSRLVGPTRA